MKTLLPLLAAVLLAVPASAQARRNVLETLTAALAGDKAYDDAERARILGAIKDRFADYGFQIVEGNRAAAIPVVLHVITEGSFDQAAPERVADVAFAAYQAMGRGAPAEEVSGIALYGYSKNIPGERIALWANGYRQLVENKVPGPVAADLVHLAMRRDLPDSDFDILKWAMVNGVKEGYDAKDYAIYLFGHVLEGKRGPGAVSGDAKAAFRRAKAQGRRVALPPYEGIFTPPPPPAPTYVAPVAPAPKAAPQEEIAQAPSAPAAEEPAAPAAETPSEAKPSAPAPKARPAQTAPSKPAAAAKAPGAAAKGPAAETAAPPAMSPSMASLWPGLDASYHSYLGTPYVWGGTSHSGIDCSGLTSSTYGENKVKIPRVSRDQYRIGATIEEPALRDGDLVFFNTLGAGVSHVGMVVDAKNRKFVQASSSKGVTVSPLDNKYYHTRYLGARRVVQ